MTSRLSILFSGISEVKRHPTVVELHKATEIIASERMKMERMLSEARRQAAEEALASLNRQEEHDEVRPSRRFSLFLN